MSAAAEAVFSIPELLETILLDTSTDEQLFILQRVNRTFNGTIAGSAKLLRRMGLLHTNSCISSIKAADLLSKYVVGDSNNTSIQITPFAIDLEKKAWLFTRGYYAWTLNVNLDLTFPRNGQLNKQFGLTKRGKLHAGEQHSWRRMKFTAAPIKVELHIRCYGQMASATERISLSRQDAYPRFAKGACTLGEVVDIVERVTRIAEARWHRKRRFLNCVIL